MGSELVDGYAPVQQIAAVVVSVAEGNAEKPWSRKRAVRSDHGERYWRAIVSPRSGQGRGVRDVVKGGRSDLGGLKIDARAGIAERDASSWLVGIVRIEAELGLAAMLAVEVAATGSFVGGAGALASDGDAGSGPPLPREIRNRRTRMVSRIGNVDEMVRVHSNLEEIGEAAVGTAQQAAG